MGNNFLNWIQSITTYRTILLGLFCCLFLQALEADEPKEDKRWVVYYADQATPAMFSPYSLVVLDSGYPYPIEALQERGKVVLGYISLGEVEKYNFYYKKAKELNLLLEENKDWPGSFMVDLRDPLWTKMVIEEIIPTILHKGFNGLMFDTLDDAEFLEEKNPQKYKGMQQAAINLVKAIRLNYPQILIMMNRGFSILPQVAPLINMELAESTFGDYNFEKKRYTTTPEKEYKEYVNTLNAVKQKNPQLEIYSLDYATDPNLIRRIYQIQRQQGFIPYVTTINLDKITPEPNSPK